MEIVAPPKASKHFETPHESLADLDPDVAATLIAAAADVALVIDPDGVIRDISFGNEDLLNEGGDAWLGRKWSETVTVESRSKIEDLLKTATSAAPTRWRQVNHPSPRGPDLPVSYCTGRVGTEGRIVAIGRALRPLALLQP
ncbi:PAS domain-containing protein, partial [Nostoc sp. NIES-2111]